MFEKNEEVERPLTLALDRALTDEELRLAERLLQDAGPSAASYLPQLLGARVTGHCTCGCPTVYLQIEKCLRADPVENPVGDMLEEVNGNLVGIMLLQSGGYLSCLEVYDLSELERPYGLPSMESLRPFRDQSLANRADP